MNQPLFISSWLPLANETIWSFCHAAFRVVVQVKSFCVILVVVMEMSTPLLAVFPMFANVVKYPVTEGIVLSSSRSEVLEV